MLCDLVVQRQRRAFSAATPQAWNRLPTELKLLQSTITFHCQLKTFLFQSAYRHWEDWWLFCDAPSVFSRGAIQMTQLQLHHLLIISKFSPHTIPEQDLLSKHAKHDLYLHNNRWDNTHKTLRSIIHILKLKPLLLLKSVSKSHTQH